MSLRARLLAAFAYTLIVVIVALEVPLSTNVSDRVNAEVEADSAAQAQVVAASVADQLRTPARLQQVATQASARLDGLVFIIDGRGREIASSDPAAVANPPQLTDDPISLQALGGNVAQGRQADRAAPAARAGTVTPRSGGGGSGGGSDDPPGHN